MAEHILIHVISIYLICFLLELYCSTPAVYCLQRDPITDMEVLTYILGGAGNLNSSYGGINTPYGIEGRNPKRAKGLRCADQLDSRSTTRALVRVLPAFLESGSRVNESLRGLPDAVLVQQDVVLARGRHREGAQLLYFAMGELLTVSYVHCPKSHGAQRSFSPSSVANMDIT